MANVPLTRRQREIVEFFRGYVDEHSISPTLEEIAAQFGVNKVTIFGHVSELERKGVLKRAARGISRGLQLVSDEGGSDSARVEMRLPILGNIAAGAPIEAIETPEELDLGDLVPRDRDVYALRVQGESMIEDAIADGDIVLVERRDDARDGETVVAIVEGEATLKRLYREDGGYRLQPANQAMQPIRVPEVEVRGVVIGVVRRY
ncbi:MAG: transcriptional repressor LexA [bacterium]|nr:transcriptional repressor LexA [bacterium]